MKKRDGNNDLIAGHDKGSRAVKYQHVKRHLKKHVQQVQIDRKSDGISLAKKRKMEVEKGQVSYFSSFYELFSILN